jgi:3-isopropylmalate/(R)-2-methylmalate dehydratase large subunit
MSTISEKILADASNLEKVSAGDFVKANVDIALNHDVTSVLAFEAMYEMGSKEVWDPEKVVMVLDHVAPPSSVNSARVHNVIRDFIQKQKIENFYDVNSGVCHQVLPEKGFVKPGMLIIGADSHTCTHGAFGAFATGVGSTDMGAVLARGKTWLKVPESIRVNISGKLVNHVYPKDVILKIAKEIGVSGATYMALEYHGDVVKDMSVSGRMTLCNMAIEMGGKAGICEADQKTVDWLNQRTAGPYRMVKSDADAKFRLTLNIDVTDMEPQVACPDNVDNVKPVSQLRDIKINQAFIGSCTNGRLEDLEQAHSILKDRKVNSNVRLLVVPASRDIYKKALQTGIIEDLLDSGAIISNPSCAACFGGHIGILGPGEKGISTSNRNFRGRQGSPESEVYLSSAAVAAASALTGYITNPEEVI